jgi:uncharacterized protein YceK
MKMAVLVLIILIFLYGCGSTPRWVKTDFNQQQYERDTYECELQRSQYEGPRPDLPTNIAGWNFYKRCMEIRGYSLQK